MSESLRVAAEENAPWVLTLPFAGGVLAIGLGAIFMSVMQHRVSSYIDNKTTRRQRRRVPSLLKPRSVEEIVTWCSDAGQAVVTVLTPCLGLAILSPESDTTLAVTLAILIFLAGLLLFFIVFKQESPSRYARRLQKYKTWVSGKSTARRALLLPVTGIITLGRKVNLTLVPLVGILVNFALAGVVLLVGYV